MQKSLGTFIRERRQDLGLTQEQLAERVGDGVRQSEISRLEHDGIALPRRGRLERIAAALEVTVGDLMVTTGWMDEEHVGAMAAGPEAEPGPPVGDLDASGAESLTQAMEGLAAAKGLVAQTVVALGAAEQALSAARRSLRRHPRGTVTDGVGVIKEWETSAAFAA